MRQKSNNDPFAEFKNITQLGKKNAYIGLETSFQASAYQFIKKLSDNPLVQHVAVERQTKTITTKTGRVISPRGMALKAQGVQAGFPDLAIYQARGPYNGLAIELKVKGGKVSDAQYYMLSWLERSGWLVFIAWNTGSLAKICQAYWDLPLRLVPDAGIFGGFDEFNVKAPPPNGT